MNYRRLVGLLVVSFLGCQNYKTVRVKGQDGNPSVYIDPGTSGPNKGVGIESQDIISMTDRIVRDILNQPSIFKGQKPPKVIVDAKYFRNESISVINKNIITDMLRNHLVRSARGRILFLGREYVKMLENQDGGEGVGGKVDVMGGVKKVFEWDYRMGGRITSIHSTNPKTGMRSTFYHFSLELVSAKDGVIVWSGSYDLKKVSREDIIYR